MSKKKYFDISLDVAKLRDQKKHFIQGKKGEYLDLRMIELENKQYNDFMVVVKVSKADYEAGVKGDIVGYGKDWDLHNKNQASVDAQATPGTIESDDLPF